MTERDFLRSVLSIVGILFAYLLAITALYLYSSSVPKDLLRDTTVIIVAIAAAWLSYCISRRSSYLEYLRSVWHQLVVAVHDCIAYTRLNSPTPTDHAKVLRTMRIMIDELRGTFMNIKETERDIGLYMFEDIKCIYDEIDQLGAGTLDPQTAEETRGRILARLRLRPTSM